MHFKYYKYLFHLFRWSPRLVELAWNSLRLTEANVTMNLYSMLFFNFFYKFFYGKISSQ